MSAGQASLSTPLHTSAASHIPTKRGTRCPQPQSHPNRWRWRHHRSPPGRNVARTASHIVVAGSKSRLDTIRLAFPVHCSAMSHTPPEPRHSVVAGATMSAGQSAADHRRTPRPGRRCRPSPRYTPCRKPPRCLRDRRRCLHHCTPRPHRTFPTKRGTRCPQPRSHPNRWRWRHHRSPPGRNCRPNPRHTSWSPARRRRLDTIRLAFPVHCSAMSHTPPEPRHSVVAGATMSAGQAPLITVAHLVRVADVARARVTHRAGNRHDVCGTGVVVYTTAHLGRIAHSRRSAALGARSRDNIRTGGAGAITEVHRVATVARTCVTHRGRGLEDVGWTRFASRSPCTARRCRTRRPNRDTRSSLEPPRLLDRCR